MNFQDMSSVRILHKKEKANHECQKNDDLKCTTDQPNLSKYRIVTRCEKSKYQTSTSKENLLVWQNHSSEAEKVKVSKTTNE